MAVGSPLFRFIRANAVVTLKTASVSVTGGTVVTWVALKAGVDVVISNARSSRQFQAGTFDGRGEYAVSGREPYLQRADIRLLVTAAAPGMAGLVGRYLSVVTSQTHARGGAGLVQERVSLSCTVLAVPADAGTTL